MSTTDLSPELLLKLVYFGRFERPVVGKQAHLPLKCLDVLDSKAMPRG